jgi:hypothetical protein
LDEVDAIGDVEREFGVQLDYSNSREWTTVGDVFAALLQSLPSEQAEATDLWPRFVIAISEETGVDPAKVTRSTLLLGTAIFDWRLALIVGCGIGLALAIARFW